MWELLALIRIKLGELHQAMGAIEKAANLTHTESSIYYNLGLIQYRLGNISDAVSSLQQSTRLTANPNTYYLLGLCADQQRNTTAAIQYYQNCIASAADNDNPSVQEALNRLREVTGN